MPYDINAAIRNAASTSQRLVAIISPSLFKLRNTLSIMRPNYYLKKSAENFVTDSELNNQIVIS